jgi:hypothetical protein
LTPPASLEDILQVNSSVQNMLELAMKKELLLDSKLKKVTQITTGSGATGATGDIGPVGATGATGATGTGLSEFAYIYNLLPQTIAIEADVPFDTNGILTAGITHAPGTPSILFSTPGIYEVTFSVSGTEPNQFALFLNGTEVPGTVYGAGAGTQQNNGQAIFTIAAGDTLTLRNHSSAAAVGLASLVGGTQANVNASVVIKKLN